MAVMLCVFVIGQLLVTQEDRWKQLDAQVDQLYDRGKYADALPLAQQSIYTAVATIGPEDPNTATAERVPIPKV
jgi:hypothetical protein